MNKMLNGKLVAMTNQEIDEFNGALIDPKPVYPSLTPRQIRMAMLSIGITDTMVKANINDPFASIEWEYATEYRRDHPLVGVLQQILGVPTEQLDSLWLWAANI